MIFHNFYDFYDFSQLSHSAKISNTNVNRASSKNVPNLTIFYNLILHVWFRSKRDISKFSTLDVFFPIELFLLRKFRTVSETIIIKDVESKEKFSDNRGNQYKGKERFGRVPWRFFCELNLSCKN